MADDLRDPQPEPMPAPEPLSSPEPAPEPIESFIDPSTLPEEIKPHWKRMHRAYTKALEQTKGRKPDLEMLDRFRADPQYAAEVIRQESTRLGLTQPGMTSPAGGTGPAPTGERPPAPLIEAIRANLPQELQWMAEAQAAAFWAANKLTLAPLMQRTQASEKVQRETQFDDLAEQLSTEMPGWEEHEDEIDELLTFLQSDAITHRTFGSKLKLLAQMVMGNGAAVSEAARRMSEAGRNRTVTGQPGRSITDNFTDRIRKAPTDQEAWKLAADAALQELKAHGVSVKE